MIELLQWLGSVWLGLILLVLGGVILFLPFFLAGAFFGWLKDRGQHQD